MYELAESITPMSDHDPRLFETSAQIIAIGEGLLDRSLPREAWTHEAHLGACTWIVRDRQDIDADNEMRNIISGYNVAVGGVNDDAQGYHHSITMVYIAAVRAHIIEQNENIGLLDLVNSLLQSARGRRDLPLRHYSRELLFSVTARRDFVPPDILPLSEI